MVWKTCKLTSTVKQQINMDAAQQLLAGVQQIAEIFWDTKGVKTKRLPSGQPSAARSSSPSSATACQDADGSRTRPAMLLSVAGTPGGRSPLFWDGDRSKESRGDRILPAAPRVAPGGRSPRR